MKDFDAGDKIRTLCADLGDLAGKVDHTAWQHIRKARGALVTLADELDEIRKTLSGISPAGTAHE